MQSLSRMVLRPPGTVHSCSSFHLPYAMSKSLWECQIRASSQSSSWVFHGNSLFSAKTSVSLKHLYRQYSNNAGNPAVAGGNAYDSHLYYSFSAVRHCSQVFIVLTFVTALRLQRLCSSDALFACQLRVQRWRRSHHVRCFSAEYVPP